MQQNCMADNITGPPVAGRAEAGVCGNAFEIGIGSAGRSSSRSAVSFLRPAYGGQGARGYSVKPAEKIVANPDGPDRNPQRPP
jgi:hypothetical protein